MHYRPLGRWGLKVSELCLGTMTFGHGADLADAQRMVACAFDHGVNFFDTANTYGNGESKTMLGKALAGRRAEAVVATKFFNPTGPGPNDSGMSRAHLFHAIDGSLRRLQMDHVDLYYIHHVDTQTPLDEILEALDDLVRAGKVRYTACSNYQAWRLATALGLSEARGWTKFAAYQPLYNLVTRDIEQELIPLCQHWGLGVVVWSPLAGGFLSGKYRPGQQTISGTRSEEDWAYPGKYFAANADETLACLLEVAADLGRSPAQVALRWVLEQPGITSAIVGARTVEQLQDNLGAGAWCLETESIERAATALAQLSRVSHLPDRYPESMEKNMHERRDSAVKTGSSG